MWLRGQAVKTSPFHGGNTGSIPVGVILDSSAVEHSAVNRRVVGSNPTRGVFLSDTVDTPSGDNTRLHGQAVKTSPFHGGNTGSIPVGVIGCKADSIS